MKSYEAIFSTQLKSCPKNSVRVSESMNHVITIRNETSTIFSKTSGKTMIIYKRHIYFYIYDTINDKF